MGQMLLPLVGGGPYGYQWQRFRLSWGRLKVLFGIDVYLKGGCYKGIWSCSLQHVLGSNYGGVSSRVLSILLSKLFEWVWATCCRIHCWHFVVCICLGINYRGLMVFQFSFVEHE